MMTESQRRDRAGVDSAMEMEDDVYTVNYWVNNRSLQTNVNTTFINTAHCIVFYSYATRTEEA
jgi:hypothetical protein